MKIEISTKEIAELVELLTRRESAKENIKDTFLRACEQAKHEFLADVTHHKEPRDNF